MTVTWNPSDKGADITLSNGNLTVTNTAGGGTRVMSVRGTLGKSSGKWYYEVTVGNQPTSYSIGVATGSAVVNDSCFNGAGIGYYTDAHLKINNAVTTSFGSTFTTGDVIGIAFDSDADKVWFSKNGTWQGSGDPASGANPAYSGSQLAGTIYPAVDMANFSSPSLTAAFASFTYTVPTGFAALSDTVTGTLAVTEAQDTTSNSGTVTIPTGSMALTEAQDTMTISGYNSTPYTVTWNPSDKGANVALSNGNLTATFNSSAFNNQTVRATLGRSTGKHYWEYTHGGGVDFRLSGICSGNVDVSTGFAASAEGFGYFGSDGKKYTSNVGSTFGATYNTDVIGVAVDLANHKVWFSKNGTWQASGDPVAGTNPAFSTVTNATIYPASMGNTPGQTPSCTANFGATAFSYGPPTGYTGWNTDNLVYNTFAMAVTEGQDTAAITGSYTAHGPLAATEAQDTATVTGVTVNTHVNVFVAVGANGYIGTSTDSTSWIKQFSPVTVQLNGVAQAGSGGDWMAVGYSGKILHSHDLISWTVVPSGITSNLEDVYWGNGVWIAVGWTGKILRSTDGITWAPVTSGTTNALRTVLYVGGVWLAMGDGGTYRTSVNDGQTWDSHSALSPATSFYDLCYADDLGLWVAVGNSAIWTSPDAGNWTKRYSPASVTYGVVWADPYVVATAGNLDIYTSTNGTSYTANTALSGGGSFRSAAFDGTNTVIVGQIASPSSAGAGYSVTDPTATLTGHSFDPKAGASTIYEVVLGDEATPTIPDIYGGFAISGPGDTCSMSGQSTATSVTVNMAVTEAQDIFSNVELSTTISGGFDITEAADTASFEQGGGIASVIQILPATFDAIVTYGAFLFNGGLLRVYSGSQPTSPTDAPSGTLLAEITLPDPAFVEADSGACIKTGDWSGTAADTGVAGWFRLISADGVNSIDGTVTTSLGSGDIIASTTNFTVGDPVVVASATFQFTLLDE